MYGLPQDFDYSIFAGRTLRAVTFTINTVHLMFDEDLSITIESSYAHQVDNDDQGRKEEVPAQHSTLMSLIENTVKSAEDGGNGTLVLRFKDEQVLQCFDDSPQYESYRITNRGKDTFV